MAVPVARSISQESEEGRGNAWDGRMVCSHDVLWIRFCGQTHQRQMWSVRGGRTLLTHAKLPVVCSHEHTHTLTICAQWSDKDLALFGTSKQWNLWQILTLSAFEVLPGYCCYVLRSFSGLRTYTGITTDLSRRLRQHNGEIRGGAKATRSGGPWNVLCVVACLLAVEVFVGLEGSDMV